MPASRVKKWGVAFVLGLAAMLAAAFPLLAAEPAPSRPTVARPVIPVGEDAYLRWDLWPLQRPGVRAYMRSTYDRHGGNRTADAAHFLYQRDAQFNVTLDVQGRGVLYFARYNHWHGSPWHYEVDGQNFLVDERSPRNPRADRRVADGEGYFTPRTLFPNPLTWTYVQTKGANLMWRPIPFEERFRMAYSHTFYGTGYYIYHLFNEDTPLSQPIRSWDGQTPPDPAVLALLNRAGQDIAPAEGTDGTWKRTGCATLPSGEAVCLAQLEDGPGMLRALKLSAPRDQAVALGECRIRVTWDDRRHPSIDAPLALFFGTGTLYNRNNQQYLVQGLPLNVRFDEHRVHLACYFPMPYFRSARFELIGHRKENLDDVTWELRGQPYAGPARHVGYFHATYRDHPHPRPGFDLVWLDTDQVEGGGSWSGQFVGTTYIFTDRAFLPTLEGDPRFFFDDSLTPQAQGTGSEEWGGGGDYWGGRTMSLPLAGHPVGAPSRAEAQNELDLIHSAYRFLLADLFPFGKRAVIRFEHGGVNESQEHYQTVVYWYGLPAARLVLTDQLDIGDPSSEQAHDYHSPQASEPYELTSRYEWGAAEIPVADMPVQANPDSLVEFEFEADAGKRYYLWLRGKSSSADLQADAVWMQFDEQIGTPQLGESYDHPKGFGNWRDIAEPDQWAWSSALPNAPAQTVTFARPGRHRLRLQPRQVPHTIDQIWLSSTQQTRPEHSRPVPSPPRPAAEGASNDQIVLTANDIVRRSGQMQIRQDETASVGRVLYVARPSQTATPTEQPVPELTRTGRTTTGTSSFTLNLEPDNQGVLLRRTLDYAYPNQRARVSVAPLEENGRPGTFEEAGIWYLAGSTTYYHAYPPEELDPPQPHVLTSPRRFRDDEFMLPQRLTRGRDRIRVQIEFLPVDRPLLPGMSLPERAWSEIAYQAYCWVEPDFDPHQLPPD